MSRRTLAELDGSLTTTDWGHGVKLPCVLMDCPTCGGHAQVIPYSDEPCHRVQAGERIILVWQRVSGSTLDDITLAPSFLVQSCGLHGFVRSGHWEDC